jgi:HEAT repeat protein
VLGHILAESDPLGADHAVVLEALTALGSLGPLVTDTAVGTVAGLMRRRRWFARRKARALATGAAVALRQVGTPAAQAALVEAGRQGDRLLRKIVGTVP